MGNPDQFHCKLFWRVKGTSTFKEDYMTRINSSGLYSYPFDPSLDGKTVECYIMVERDNFNHVVYRPMGGVSEGWDPNSEFGYYEILVTKGSITSTLETDKQEIIAEPETEGWIIEELVEPSL